MAFGNILVQTYVFVTVLEERLKQFIIGQRWISESEPELGLGIIVEVEAKTVTCFFAAAKVDRKYGSQTAPLRRIRFVEGDEVKGQDGEVFIVKIGRAHV